METVASHSASAAPSKAMKRASCALNCTENSITGFSNNIHVSHHPVVVTKINRMRRKDTDSKLYRELMYEVGTFLAYEATSDLSLKEETQVLILFKFHYIDLRLGGRCSWSF